MPIEITRELLNAETLKVLGFLLAIFAISTFAIVRSVFPFVKGLASMGVNSFEKAWAQMVSVQEDVTKALKDIREMLNQNTQAIRENTARIEQIENYLGDHIERIVEQTVERTTGRAVENAIRTHIVQAGQNKRKHFLWW